MIYLTAHVENEIEKYKINKELDIIVIKLFKYMHKTVSLCEAFTYNTREYKHLHDILNCELSRGFLIPRKLKLQK